MRKRLFLIIFLLAIITIGYKLAHRTTTTTVKHQQSASQQPTHGSTGFNKRQYSLTDPTSMWIVVNKQRPLTPRAFVPSNLVTPTVAKRDDGMLIRADASAALNRLFAAASANGTPLKLSSAYRSYDYQVNLYNGYVAQQGQATADSESARPGYSEHQTGLAADVSPLDGTCNLNDCFADTPAGQWLAANAYKYGFIVRYGKDLTPITGYAYEPWHIRYIGTDLSQEMHRQHILTLEQFFGLPLAPNY